MTYKNILLPITSGDTGDAVLNTALKFARDHDGHIEGIALSTSLVEFVAVDMFAAEVVGVMEAKQTAFANDARKRFVAFMSENGVPEQAPVSPANGVSCGWWSEIKASEADICARARIFDMTVVGRPGPNAPSQATSLVESLLFDSGRPVLVVPPAPPATIGHHIVIVWNRSSETALAVALAMPLLEEAERVTVMDVEGVTLTGPSGPDLAAKLGRHGIKVDHTVALLEGRSIGAAVVGATQRLGADLMVKGAYTQSRLRQMIFGGMTSHLLAETPIPMFMAR